MEKGTNGFLRRFETSLPVERDGVSTFSATQPCRKIAAWSDDSESFANPGSEIPGTPVRRGLAESMVGQGSHKENLAALVAGKAGRCVPGCVGSFYRGYHREDVCSSPNWWKNRALWVCSWWICASSRKVRAGALSAGSAIASG